MINLLKENQCIKQNLPFENLLEGFILAQMIFDEKGQPIDYKILEVNISSLLHTSLKREQVLGGKTKELFDLIKCKWVELFGNVVRLGKPAKFEKYSEDLSRWFKLRAYSLYKDHQFMVIFEDITERKNNQITLRVGDEKYSNLFKNTINALSYCEFIFDNQGNPCDIRLLEVNPAQEKLLGIPRDEIVGKTCAELDLLTSPQGIEVIQGAERAIRSGKSYQTQYFCFSLNKWLEVKIFTIYNDYFGLILTDITERIKVEEALTKENKDLEEKAAQLTSKLQIKNTLLKLEIEKVKKAEKALRESEEKYRSILNSMDESFGIIEMIFDTKGKPVDWRYLEVNPMHEICFGMKNVEGKLISQLAPKIAQNFFDIYGKVALTGEPVCAVEGAFGKERSYNLYAFRIGGQDSRKVAVLAYDITERKKNKEMLTFQANLLSSVHDVIIAVDENDKYTYWNKMAEKILGFSAQEVIGLSPGEVKTNKGTVRYEVTNLFKDGYYIGEINCRRKDGVIITADAHFRVLVNEKGEYKGFICSLRDITERKQKEKELNAIKESLAAEVEALNKLHSLSTRFILKDNLKNIYGEILDIAIILTKADKGSLSIYNERKNRLEILDHRGFETHFPNYYKHISIKESTAVSKAFEHRKRIIIDDVSQNTMYFETDRRVILDEGVQALQATPLISSSGNIVGILATHYITLHQFEERELRTLDLLARQAADAIERTRAEETIHQSEKRAFALVEELRRMDQNKNHFLSMLSHELRNPLASIMMSVSLLDRVTPGGEQFRQAKEIIDRQTTQLSRLVDDLLDITRITQNKIGLKKENINLNELISRALEDYKEQLASKGVKLEVELTSVPLHMEADPARLTQVIGNLINNAAKFTGMGDSVQVRVWKDEDKQEVVICVKDDGLGIKPDILPDLFLPFIQVDSSLNRSSGGLGLGLAIVKGMVELHGGNVAAASEGLGKGAQFTIHLPLPAVPDNQVKQLQPNGKPSRTLRILVIDDIPDVAEIVCSLLRFLGHEVISANSGSEGIVKAKSFHPEILFCDIGMPGMNGYEVAEIFRRNKELNDIFLVALTGYAQSDDLERARVAGFNRHLAKPVNMAILEQTLAEVMSR